MQWFGRRHWAMICDDVERAETPVGATCAHCGEAIKSDDDGILMPQAFHADCHIRRIVGGLNHQRGRCTCCGGTEPPDPPELSRREAARRAVAYWRSNGLFRSDETGEEMPGS